MASLSLSDEGFEYIYYVFYSAPYTALIVDMSDDADYYLTGSGTSFSLSFDAPDSDTGSVDGKGNYNLGNVVTMLATTSTTVLVGDSSGSFLLSNTPYFQSEDTVVVIPYDASNSQYVLGNRPPIGPATAKLPGGEEDASYALSASDLLQGFSDPDGDTLAVAGLAADHGTLRDNADGTWTFTPEANYSGAVTLRYTVNDDRGGSVAGQQSFILAAVNDAPALADASFTLAENSAKGTAVGLIQGKDMDSAALAYSFAAGNADWDGDGQPAFAIDPKTGALGVGSVLDLDVE
jgi:hypothetical protein